MKKLKKTRVILPLMMIILLNGVIVNASITDDIRISKENIEITDKEENITEDETAKEIYYNTGMKLTAKVGKLNYDGPTIFSNDDIGEEIYHRTGMRLGARVGKLTYKKPTVNNSVGPFAINSPTSEAPSYPYSANWSNTRNFTYTKYYFSEGDFDADASGPFDAEFYYKDGTYGGTIAAEYLRGSYQVRAFTTGMDYYYVVLINNSSSPAKNATYVAY